MAIVLVVLALGLMISMAQATPELASKLESMDDDALYALLGPLLQRRPQLRASLLQAQPPTSAPAPTPTPTPIPTTLAPTTTLAQVTEGAPTMVAWPP